MKSLKYVAVLALVAALWCVWWFGFHGVDPGLIINPPPIDEPAPAGLHELVTLDIDAADVNAPHLAQLLAQLSARHDVPLELDPAVNFNINVSLHVRDVPLDHVLEILINQIPNSTSIEVREGVVRIGSWLPAGGPFAAAPPPPKPVPQLYPLGELLEHAAAPEIAHAVATAAVDTYSGCSLQRLPGGMIVTNSATGHARTAQLLAGLAHERHAPERAAQAVWYEGPTAPDDDLAAQLAKPVDVVLARVPLSQVPRELERQTGVRCELMGIATGRVTAAELDSQRVSFHAWQMPLRDVLHQVCAQIDYQCTARGSIVWLHNYSHSDARPIFGFYPIDDLVAALDHPAAPLSRVDFVQTVGEHFNLGGTLISVGDLLVDLDADVVHDNVYFFLADLRAGLAAIERGQPPPSFRDPYLDSSRSFVSLRPILEGSARFSAQDWDDLYEETLLYNFGFDGDVRRLGSLALVTYSDRGSLTAVEDLIGQLWVRRATPDDLTPITLQGYVDTAWVARLYPLGDVRDEWAWQDNPYSLDYRRYGDYWFVAGPRETHRAAERMLAQLRTPAQRGAKRRVLPLAGATTAEMDFVDALQRPVTLQVSGVDARELAAQLAAAAGAAISIDCDVPPHEPLSLDAQDAPLGLVLASVGAVTDLALQWHEDRLALDHRSGGARSMTLLYEWPELRRLAPGYRVVESGYDIPDHYPVRDERPFPDWKPPRAAAWPALWRPLGYEHAQYGRRHVIHALSHASVLARPTTTRRDDLFWLADQESVVPFGDHVAITATPNEHVALLLHLRSFDAMSEGEFARARPARCVLLAGEETEATASLNLRRYVTHAASDLLVVAPRCFFEHDRPRDETRVFDLRHVQSRAPEWDARQLVQWLREATAWSDQSHLPHGWFNNYRDLNTPLQTLTPVGATLVARCDQSVMEQIARLLERAASDGFAMLPRPALLFQDTLSVDTRAAYVEACLQTSDEDLALYAGFWLGEVPDLGEDGAARILTAITDANAGLSPLRQMSICRLLVTHHVPVPAAALVSRLEQTRDPRLRAILLATLGAQGEAGAVALAEVLRSTERAESQQILTHLRTSGAASRAALPDVLEWGFLGAAPDQETFNQVFSTKSNGWWSRPIRMRWRPRKSLRSGSCTPIPPITRRPRRRRKR